MPGIIKRDGTIVQMPELSEEDRVLAWRLYFMHIPNTIRAEAQKMGLLTPTTEGENENGNAMD